MIKHLLKWLKTPTSKYDLKLREIVSNTYKSVRVVGRGTIRIDPDEVVTTQEWKDIKQKVKEIEDEQ